MGGVTAVNLPAGPVKVGLEDSEILLQEQRRAGEVIKRKHGVFFRFEW